MKKTCRMRKKPYLCNVFFMVLDLRLGKIGCRDDNLLFFMVGSKMGGSDKIRLDYLMSAKIMSILYSTSISSSVKPVTSDMSEAGNPFSFIFRAIVTDLDFSPSARPFSSPSARPFSKPSARPFSSPSARPFSNPSARPFSSPSLLAVSMEFLMSRYALRLSSVVAMSLSLLLHKSCIFYAAKIRSFHETAK